MSPIRTHRLSRLALVPLAASLAFGLNAFSAPAAEAATYYCNGYRATIVGTNGNNDIEGSGDVT